MTILYKSVRNVTPPNSDATLYTVPANTEAYLLGISLSNGTTATTTTNANSIGTLDMKLGGFYLFIKLRVPYMSTHEVLNGQKIMLTAGETIITKGNDIPQFANRLALCVSLMEVS